MKRLRLHNRRRRGFSLLEMMAAAAITATLMAATMVVLRSSYAAWQAHEGDLDRAAAADAVLRHVVRSIRQAESVVLITDGTDTNGRLQLRDASGATVSWEYSSLSGVGYALYNGAGVLAVDINQLIFEGFEADGVTPTTVPDDVQLIRCTVQVTLPRGAGQTRTVSCFGWLRSW